MHLLYNNYIMQRLQLIQQTIAQPQTIYDYIVVGAGISGIQAADIITEKPNNTLLILQAQPSIGGRIGSISIGALQQASKASWVKENINKIKAAIVEKGATWIEERHLVLKELCKQFGISLREQHSIGHTTYVGRDKTYTHLELMNHPQYAPIIKKIVNLIDSISIKYNEVIYSNLNITTPQAKQMFRKYDRQTLRQFLQENIPPNYDEIMDIFDGFFQHSQCVSCAENSMHEVLTKNARSNDVAIIKEFLGDFGHEPSYLVNGGTALIIQKFIEKIQKKLKSSIDKILKLKHQVITVDNRPNKPIVVVCQTQGKIVRFKCRHIICAIPLAVSRNISFSNISTGKRLIIDNQLRTNSNKSFMIVKKPFWRKDKQGKPFANGDGLFSSKQFVNMCHDISPIDQSCGIIVFFHNGNKLDAWETAFELQDHEKKKSYFIDLMIKMFNVQPCDKESLFQQCFYYEISYMSDQFIRSGFQSNTRPGTFNEVLQLGDSLNALYRDQNGITFIGSQYSLQYASYMQGAVRIAREKLYKLIGQTDPLAHLLVQNIK